jgi:hypothetical protein
MVEIDHVDQGVGKGEVSRVEASFGRDQGASSLGGVC